MQLHGQHERQPDAAQDAYYGSFQAEEYRKPAYAVSISTPNQPWVSGDHIPVTVNARYDFDQPVAGGKVTLQMLGSEWYDPATPGVRQADPEQAELGRYQGGAPEGPPFAIRAIRSARAIERTSSRHGSERCPHDGGALVDLQPRGPRDDAVGGT